MIAPGPIRIYPTSYDFRVFATERLHGTFDTERLHEALDTERLQNQEEPVGTVNSIRLAVRGQRAHRLRQLCYGMAPSGADPLDLSPQVNRCAPTTTYSGRGRDTDAVADRAAKCATALTRAKPRTS